MRLSASAALLVLLAPLAAFGQTPPAAAPPADAPPPPPPPVEMAPPPPAPVVVVPAPAPVVMVAPAPAPAPAPPATPWYQKLTMEALVDSYYMFNFTNNENTLNGPSTVRQFDTMSNSFTLNYAKVGLGLAVENVAFRLDLGYGATGAIINGASGGASAAPDPMTPTVLTAQLYGNAFIVQQAFASLTIPGAPLTIDFGKFVTTAGAEVIEANKNWMYSRSMLFFTIPLLHTGVRANVKVSDQLSLQASVVNGINSDPDPNGEKTFGVSATITPMPSTSIIATGYFGKEGPNGSETDWRVIADLVASHTLSDTAGLNLNVDYIKLGEANTIGAAAMARFVLNPNLVLAARGEFISDKGGLSFGVFPGEDRVSYYEGTLMLGLPFAGHFEARVEARGDFASQVVFSSGEKNQFTALVAFLGFI
jgi:hypothetical protein